MTRSVELAAVLHAVPFATQRSIKGLGYRFVGPEVGKLARGDEGVGRMARIEEIVEKVVELLKPGS